jgi:hypothetical protein
MVERDRDDEIDAALLVAIRAANASGQYPTIAELYGKLSSRGISYDEVASSADRMYRGGEVTTNATGGLRSST